MHGGSNAEKAGQNMNESFNFEGNLFTTVFGVADNENGVKLFKKTKLRFQNVGYLCINFENYMKYSWKGFLSSYE